MNRELQNINEWFISKNLSLNSKKTKFLISYKANRRDDLPLVLPKLFVNNENLSWKEHLKLTENKIAKKKTGLIYKAKSYLNKDSFLAL